jgi:hypothetical protein
MATPKQTAANRMNAQKSTGPRTTAGKAVSRFNALKHGIYAVHQIMFDEKPEDLAELTTEYHDLCAPADAKERLLVDALVHNEWRLRRMRRVEAELWQSAYDHRNPFGTNGGTNGCRSLNPKAPPPAAPQPAPAPSRANPPARLPSSDSQRPICDQPNLRALPSSGAVLPACYSC